MDMINSGGRGIIEELTLPFGGGFGLSKTNQEMCIISTLAGCCREKLKQRWWVGEWAGVCPGRLHRILLLCTGLVSQCPHLG